VGTRIGERSHDGAVVLLLSLGRPSLEVLRCGAVKKRARKRK
jgi:hypothetical protein